MPVILTTPSEAIAMAREACIETSAEIKRLESSPLAQGETIDDRMRKIAALALAMAEAFDLLDSIAVALHEVRREMRAEAKRAEAEGSPQEAPTGHRGVPPGEVN